MNLESLLKRLDQIHLDAENDEAPELGLTHTAVIMALVEYIGNKKVEEKINEIPF